VLLVLFTLVLSFLPPIPYSDRFFSFIYFDKVLSSLGLLLREVSFVFLNISSVFSQFLVGLYMRQGPFVEGIIRSGSMFNFHLPEPCLLGMPSTRRALPYM
jgi:hypothetical protein